MGENFHHLARGIFVQNNKVLIAKAKGYPNTFLPGVTLNLVKVAKKHY